LTLRWSHPRVSVSLTLDHGLANYGPILYPILTIRAILGALDLPQLVVIVALWTFYRLVVLQWTVIAYRAKNAFKRASD